MFVDYTHSLFLYFCVFENIISYNNLASLNFAFKNQELWIIKKNNLFEHGTF